MSGNNVRRNLATEMSKGKDHSQLKDWVLQGANPEFKRKVEALREAKMIASEDEETMGELLEGVLQDAILDMKKTTGSLTTTDFEDTQTATVAENMRQELHKVLFPASCM
jgi:hypothetical protein